MQLQKTRLLHLPLCRPRLLHFWPTWSNPRPASDELAPTAGKRPLAHFGQALPVTKSKAKRKLVLQITLEMYQFFALTAALPGLDGVAVPDRAHAILQAWREDYRPDIKKAAATFFKA